MFHHLSINIVLKISFTTLLWWSSYSYADTKTLAFFDLPPHGFIKDGKPFGAAVELVKEVLKDLNIKDYKIEQKPLARIISMHNDQIILYMGKNIKREKFFFFGEKPFFYMNGVIVVDKEASWQDTIENFSQLKDKKIVAWSEGFKSKKLLDAKVNFIPISGEDVTYRGISSVLFKRADGFYSPDRVNIEKVINQYPNFKNKVRILSLPEEAHGLYMTINHSVDKSFREKFQLSMHKILKQRPYETFLESVEKTALP